MSPLHQNPPPYGCTQQASQQLMKYAHCCGKLNGLAVGETARESQGEDEQGKARKKPRECGAELTGIGMARSLVRSGARRAFCGTPLIEALHRSAKGHKRQSGHEGAYEHGERPGEKAEHEPGQTAQGQCRKRIEQRLFGVKPLVEGNPHATAPHHPERRENACDPAQQGRLCLACCQEQHATAGHKDAACNAQVILDLWGERTASENRHKHKGHDAARQVDNDGRHARIGGGIQVVYTALQPYAYCGETEKTAGEQRGKLASEPRPRCLARALWRAAFPLLHVPPSPWVYRTLQNAVSSGESIAYGKCKHTNHHDVGAL